MNGGPKDRKITEYGKFSTSENMENVDGPSRLSPSTYPINNLLKQTKVSRFSPLNLLVCISDSVDFYKHLGYKMCGLSLILKTVNWQQEVFFILKINIFFFFFFFFGKKIFIVIWHAFHCACMSNLNSWITLLLFFLLSQTEKPMSISISESQFKLFGLYGKSLNKIILFF